MIALRESGPEIWNPLPLAATANTTAPPGRCRRCQCWLSVYRHPQETDCWPCRDAERLRAEAAELLLAAVAEVQAVVYQHQHDIAESAADRRPPRARYTGWKGREVERDQEIRRLLDLGWAQAEIARTLRVSFATIRAVRRGPTVQAAFVDVALDVHTVAAVAGSGDESGSRQKLRAS